MQDARSSGDLEDWKRRLARLVDQNWNTLLFAARSSGPNGDDATAEDIVQDSLVTILEHHIDLPNCDKEALALLIRRIRHVSLNVRRREKIRCTEPLAEASTMPTGAVLDAWTAATKVESKRDVRVAMQILTASEWEVTQLHGLDGHTFPQVARKRRCSVKTAKELYRRALRKLREALTARHGPEAGHVRGRTESTT